MGVITRNQVSKQNDFENTYKKARECVDIKGRRVSSKAVKNAAARLRRMSPNGLFRPGMSIANIMRISNISRYKARKVLNRLIAEKKLSREEREEITDIDPNNFGPTAKKYLEQTHCGGWFFVRHLRDPFTGKMEKYIVCKRTNVYRVINPWEIRCLHDRIRRFQNRTDK